MVESLSVKISSSGFGQTLGQMDKFNKSWDGLNKKMQPATELWNKASGAIEGLAGKFKELLGPLMIAGGLFLAFVLSGEVGRSLFGTMGEIIGAFSDLMTASFVPAIKPIFMALVHLLPMWNRIFNNPRWISAMERLGDSLGRLIESAFPLVFEIIESIVDVLPIFIDLFRGVLEIFIQIFTRLRDSGMWEAFVDSIVIIAATLALIIATPIIGFLISLVAVVLGIVVVFETFLNVLRAIWDLLGKINPLKLLGADKGSAPIAQTLGAAALNTVPGLAEGGYVSRTGLAVVHEGESYSGVGGSGSGVNVYFGPGSVVLYGGDDSTLETLAAKISEILGMELYGTVNTVR